MFTDLFEFSVSVEPTGIQAWTRKYYTKVTKANYLPERIPDHLEKGGYSVRLYGRVPLDSLMKVRHPLQGDRTSSVRREIYYLAGQEEQAKQLVMDEVNTTINRMAGQMALMQEVWKNKVKRSRSTGYI